MWNLNDKLALVTGGSKGIGRATVEEFLKLGAEVVFTARKEADIRSFEATLSEGGYKVHAIVSDVTKPEDRAELVQYIQNTFGRLDIAVHNAGINIRKPVTAYSEEEYLKIFQN